MMPRIQRLEHEWVEELPDEPAEGVLYVSMPYATAMHLCCCGCESQVFTPLRPNRWRLTFDGESVSLAPSVGNWNFPCESHYWIAGGNVRWAPAMTRREIELIRNKARADLAESPEFTATWSREPTYRRIRGLLHRMFRRGRA